MVWDVLNSHQVAMDNLHAAQMELNCTIEETHRLQSSQSVLLQVLEAEFKHFITDHWRPVQAIVHHTRVHLPCTCPLHLAAVTFGFLWNPDVTRSGRSRVRNASG